MRGYVLLKKESFVGRYDSAREEILGHHRELRALAEDNPPQAVKVEQLVALANTFAGWMDENMKLMQQGRDEEVRQRILHIDERSSLKDYREILDDFLANEGGTRQFATNQPRSGRPASGHGAARRLPAHDLQQYYPAHRI